MGKITAHTPKLTKKFYPFVSVCTPTFNRRPFIPIMLKCFLNQDYPMHRIEWIIVDDGTDCIRDLIDAANIPQIRYFREEKKMALGEKRNYMHSKAKGTIIVYMDDDDYYPPERVSHAVDTLDKNKDALCVGSSEIYVYFKHIQKMFQSGPYSPTHATAGTFAFRTELLKTNRYENHAALAEEKHFLNNYTVPFAQLDPLKTILVFSHEHNTFDKRKLLDNQHPDFFRESNKTVSMFIRQAKELDIKTFFLKDIDDLLKVYEPGEPKMKPDVLEQIKVIEADRKQIMEEEQRKKGLGIGGQLMLNEEGKPPRALTNDDIVKLMNMQIEEIKALTAKNAMLEKMVANMQKHIVELKSPPVELKSPPVELKSPPVELKSPPVELKSPPVELKSPPNIHGKQDDIINISPTIAPTSFASTLLNRIQELEEEVNVLRRSQSNIKMNETVNVPIVLKSKSVPEVSIKI